MGNKLKNPVKILKDIRNDDVNMKNFRENVMKFLCRLEMYPNNDFIRLYKKYWYLRDCI